MTRLSARAELILAATYFCISGRPAEEQARLARAAEDYLTDPEVNPAHVYTKRLAEAAANCAKATPRNFTMARQGLFEILETAVKEYPAVQMPQARAMASWQQRADLA